MRRRKVITVLAYILLCAAPIAVCLGVPRVLRSLLSQEGKPRPMFHEWLHTDWGPAWCQTPWIQDSSGTFVWLDDPLNMMVVRATGVPAFTGGFNDYGLESSVLLAGSPYSLKVDPMPNTLYVVLPSGTASRFNLTEGAARMIYDALKDRGPGTMILPSLSNHYAGEERERLHAFLEADTAGER